MQIQQKKRKEFNDKAVENFKEAVEKQKEIRDKAFTEEVAFFELSLAKQVEGSSEALKIFADLQRRKAEIEIIQNETTGKQAELIRFNTEQAIFDNAKKFSDEKDALRQKELEEAFEYGKLEAQAKQAQYDLQLQQNVEFLSKEQELNRQSLDASLADLRLNGEQKLAILASLNQQQIELLKNQDAVKQQQLEEQFANEIVGLELDSEQFAEVVARFDALKIAQSQTTEESINAINADAYEKRNQIASLELESEKNKVNAIASLAGTVAQALGEETLAGQIAAKIQAQINAYITASNVFKTLSAFAPFPIALAGAGAALVLGQKYATQIGSINTAVQTTAKTFKPSLEFANGGIVPSGFELPYSTSKGDNTLALVKPGEVILNKAQQSVIGANSFARAGVPGFADGGVVQQSSISAINSSFAINDIARAISMMPVPQVSVVDINRVQRQVNVKDNVGSLQIVL